ncbi:MAG: hypothetical protein NT069_20290 [Planctomycetota bacterium]|nr:hypothetical protein [Planctomycetota bacterium]
MAEFDELDELDNLEADTAEGLVIMALRIRDPEVRARVVHRLVNLPGHRVTATLFEITTGDWDPGLWEEELLWLRDLLEDSDDSIIVWRFSRGRYTRFTLR